MNRAEKRAAERARERRREPFAMRFTCVGVHGVECPKRASIALVLSADGLSFTPASVVDAFAKHGWDLAMFKADHDSGEELTCLDTLCPECGGELKRVLALAREAGVAPRG